MWTPAPWGSVTHTALTLSHPLGPGWRELSTSGAHSLQQKRNHGRGEALVPREVQVRVQARVGTPPLPCACSGWPAPSCTVASAQLIKVLTRWRLLRLDLHPC